MHVHREILARHEASLRGSLQLRRLQSRALGIRKSYFVYEPPGDRRSYEPRAERRAGGSSGERASELPIVYLFRGHEREWVNIEEDASRQRMTSIERVDGLIHRGSLPPVIAVVPGLNSSNNRVPSLGIDMAGTWPKSVRGLGTGRFWQFLTRELIPQVEERYGADVRGARLAAGFSLGGFTTSLLAIGVPGYFSAVGVYDGLFMWPGHDDPRDHGQDPIWSESTLFDAALGRPRHREAMQRWNPTEALLSADGEHLEKIRQTSFCIQCAPTDGSSGNRDRARFFARLLREKGLTLLSPDVVFDQKAEHTWRWTDRFLVRFLAATLCAER